MCFLLWYVYGFYEEISNFPILLFSSISLLWSLKKAFLSLLAILWNSAFKWTYLSFLLCFSLLFSAIGKASSDNHFALLHFIFLGIVLITASYTMLWTSIYSSLGTLLDLIPWIYLSPSLYNHKSLDLGYLNGLVVFPTFFNLILNFAIRRSWTEPQSAPSLVFTDYIELIHLWLQRI